MNQKSRQLLDSRCKKRVVDKEVIRVHDEDSDKTSRPGLKRSEELINNRMSQAHVFGSSDRQFVL